jgi:hypothetical protein
MMMQVNAVEKLDFVLKSYIIIATRKYYNNNLVKKLMKNISQRTAEADLRIEIATRK